MDMDVKAETLPDGQQLLELYKQQYEMFDKSLAAERDITVKNFAAFGAVLLAQSGFFVSSLKLHVVLVMCGITLLAISIAARAMSIIYSKFSDHLYILADITLTVYLRGQNGAKVRKRRLEARDGFDAEGNQVKKKLPNADDLTWRELLRYLGALSLINLIPGVVGLVIFVLGIWLWYLDPAPLHLTK